MRKYIRYTACILIFGVLVGCGSKKPIESVPALNEPVGAASDIVAVKRQDICNIRLFDGQVVPYTEEVGFNTSGIIEEICVELGDEVKKGDVLAKLTGATDNARYTSIISEIEQSEKSCMESNLTAEYDIKILELEAKQLQKKMADEKGHEKKKTANDLAVKKVDIEIAKQRLSDAKELQRIELAELRRQKSQIENEITEYSLRAGFDGIITCVGAKVGDQVTKESFVVAISDMKKKQIKADFVSKSDVEKATRYYARYNDKDYAIKQLEYDADEVKDLLDNKQKAYVYYDLKEQTEDFKVGDYIDVYVETGFSADALVIPANALYKESATYYVYANKSDIKVKTEVSVGTITPSFVEIEDGLAEGDEVYVKE